MPRLSLQRSVPATSLSSCWCWSSDPGWVLKSGWGTGSGKLLILQKSWRAEKKQLDPTNQGSLALPDETEDAALGPAEEGEAEALGPAEEGEAEALGPADEGEASGPADVGEVSGPAAEALAVEPALAVSGSPASPVRRRFRGMMAARTRKNNFPEPDPRRSVQDYP